MIPHPVQCFTIVKMIDDVLNPKTDDKGNKTRGSIGEVKTGEGKSFIIAVVAIVLAGCYGRKIDVVTSNIELAIRDQKD